MTTQTERQKLAEFLWRREGGYCVSALVYTLAQDGDHRIKPNTGLASLVDQAQELSAPVQDYEEAAIQAGFSLLDNGMWGRQEGDGMTEFDDPRAACAALELEPYDREVFEHWIVSDWLADKLEAAGEKVDHDFAGLTVWARTCAGQSIYLDGVVQRIALALWPTAEDRKRILESR